MNLQKANKAAKEKCGGPYPVQETSWLARAEEEVDETGLGVVGQNP